jgi:hypothetical protein
MQKYRIYLTGEITLHVALIVNIEQLHIHLKHGWLQMFDRKYHA